MILVVGYIIHGFMNNKLFPKIIFAAIVLFMVGFVFIQVYSDKNNTSNVDKQNEYSLDENVDEPINEEEIYGLSLEEKIYGLSLIWKRSSELFGLWELLPDTDWDKLYLEYIGEVADTKTITEYYNVLSKFIANLEDGHSGVSYPDGIKYFCSPISVKYIEGKFIVYYRDPKITKIPLGSEITKINNIPTLEYLESNFSDFTAIKTPIARENMLGFNIYASRSNEKLDLEILTPNNKVINEIITYRYPTPSLSESLQLGQGEIINEIPYSSFRVYRYENEIYRIIIKDFQNDKLPEELQSFLTNWGDRCKGFIIDVRSHDGGDGRIAIKVLSNFIDPNELSYFTVRKQYKDVSAMAEASRYLLNGNSPSELIQDGLLMLSDRSYEDAGENNKNNKSEALDLLDQPVVILSDSDTGSAGEDFVSYAKNTGRFTIMGTNTRGTTGNLAKFKLPGGGYFYISTLRCVTSDGIDITNNGIHPDIWVEQSYEDLINGIDTQLNAAIEYLENEL